MMYKDFENVLAEYNDGCGPLYEQLGMTEEEFEHEFDEYLEEDNE